MTETQEPYEILVVDDAPESLKLLGDILNGAGYVVRQTRDAGLALKSARANPPDLVLLDVCMPKLDGFEVCRQLKNDPLTNKVPVLFISALWKTEEKIKGFEVGAVDYITKPFEAEEVLVRVANQLALRAYQQQLQAQELRLQEEIAVRCGTEEALRTLNEELEQRVTERTRALQASEAQYRRLVENSPDIVYTFSSKQGGLFYSSRIESILGYSPQQMTANPQLWYKSVHPDDQEAVIDTVIRHIRHKKGFSVEYRIQDAAGNWHWLWDRSINVYTDTEETIVEGLMTDITAQKQTEAELAQYRDHLEKLVEERTARLTREIAERKRAEEALRQARDAAEAANRAKGVFLANMSHEIRTPINAIQGMTHLCLQTRPNPEQESYLNKIQTAANSLLHILDDILDFSKIESGRLEIERVPFFPHEVLDNIADMLHFTAREKGLLLKCNIAPEVPTLLTGDPLRLGQILLNLAGNALKFTAEGEVRTTVKLLETDERTVTLGFSVEDTGIGMNAEQMNKLFQPFSQADGSTTRKYGGSGLGLAISKRLVEMMQGEIRVESTAERGSTFYFTARFLRPTQEEILKSRECLDSTTSTESIHATLVGKRVLVAEDDEISREVLYKVLDQASVAVTIAKNGREAVDAVAAKPFDAVLMDMQMPELDGCQATQQIRLQPGKARLPIIAVSANAMKDDRERCLMAGMNDHMAKPFNPDDMLATLARWIKQTNDNAVAAPPPSDKAPPSAPTPKVPPPAKPKLPVNSLLPAGKPVLTPLLKKNGQTAEAESVAGLDIAAAVKRYNGSREFYLSLLTKFRERHAETAGQLRQFIQNTEIDPAIRLAHTLKGAAGNLEANRLFTAAARLEQRLKQGGEADLAELLQGTETALQEVMRSIEGLEKPAENPQV